MEYGVGWSAYIRTECYYALCTRNMKASLTNSENYPGLD